MCNVKRRRLHRSVNLSVTDCRRVGRVTFQDPLGVTVKTGYRGIVWHGLKLNNVLIAL